MIAAELKQGRKKPASTFSTCTTPIHDRTFVMCLCLRTRAIMIESRKVAPTRHPPSEAIMESTPVRNLVLCVDDEEVIRFLLESALERFGYVALVASDGREALRLAAQHRVDAVILDYCMPGMNGGEVALEMKRLRPDIPIILFSGSPDIPSSTLTHVDALVAKGEGLRPLLSVLARLLQIPGKKRSGSDISAGSRHDRHRQSRWTVLEGWRCFKGFPPNLAKAVEPA